MFIYDGPGDLLSSEAQTIVCTVNCVGAMGAGVALACKLRYPGLYEHYRRLCKSGRMVIGSIHIWVCPITKKQILLFPTKMDWVDNSEYDWVYSGLDTLYTHWNRLNITSIAFPPLGCGNGGLDYPFIRRAMEYYLENINVPIYVFHGNKKNTLL